MFRTLNADEVECRVSKVGDGYINCLLYKTARTDMDILDETLGANNWKCDYQEIHGNLFCTISIWDSEKKEWITKQNCGIESKEDNGNEKKGEASDAMKRAGFCVGIGRELYTAPQIFIRCKTTDDKGKKINHYINVDVIEYDPQRRISKLVLSEKGNVVFEWSKDSAPVQTDANPDMLRNIIIALGSSMGKDEKYTIEWCEKLFGNAHKWEDFTPEMLSTCKLKLSEILKNANKGK